MKHSRHKSGQKNFLFYGLAIFLLLFFVNIVAAYIMHFYVVGSSCMTKQQVEQDQRCLYILGNQVYEHGTREAPHQGHPCGTDVTAIIPADHIQNPALHLLPNYVANLCAASTPTPTPTPKPTATPTPKPTATLTPTPRPTMGSVITPTPSMRVSFTSTPTPTPTAIATSSPTSAASTAIPNVPTPTSIVTIPVTSTLTPVITKSADINGDGSIDIADYNALLRCYNVATTNTSPTCSDPAAADLNQDGIVNAIDYNIFLYQLYAYRLSHPITITTTPTATPSATLTPTFTPTPLINVTHTPTLHPTDTPTLLVALTATPSPTLLHISPTAIPAKKTSPIMTLVAGVQSQAAVLTQIFDWIIFLILLATLILGVWRSKFLATLLQKKKTSKNVPSSGQNTIEGVYYCKPQKEKGAVLLVDGDRQIQGYYKKGQVTEGFFKVKGIQKEESGKKFIEVIELLPVS